MHSAESKQVLAHTPYALLVYGKPAAKGGTQDSDTPLVELYGTTDAQGRSGYVRAPFPIEPDQVKFVKNVGTGQYKGAAGCATLSTAGAWPTCCTSSLRVPAVSTA
ncbi:hypothetical protein [Pseudoduganella armeniaca]|uniref:hypothetical protein n=1 Tax=Pseudoduganella armeniaca TaxID=2072590 RepID=UPI0015E73661|nr:hypothetical protein [Pseudoduganella armeniaca]